MRFIWMMAFLLASTAYAIDNPDAPDYMGEFEKRIAPYYSTINNAHTTYDYISAYSVLQKALENELDDAYKLLFNALPNEQRQLLVSSQESWNKCRDSENQFIGGVWTQDSYGTSSALTTGELRCSVIRECVEALIARLASIQRLSSDAKGTTYESS